MCVQLMKKSLKLDEKTKKKAGGLIDEKPLKLNKETRRKTNHLYVAEMKNLQNLS